MPVASHEQIRFFFPFSLLLWLTTHSPIVSHQRTDEGGVENRVSDAWENPAACKSKGRLNLSDIQNVGFKGCSEPRLLLPDQRNFTLKCLQLLLSLA